MKKRKAENPHHNVEKLSVEVTREVKLDDDDKEQTRSMCSREKFDLKNDWESETKCTGEKAASLRWQFLHSFLHCASKDIFFIFFSSYIGEDIRNYTTRSEWRKKKLCCLCLFYVFHLMGKISSKVTIFFFVKSFEMKKRRRHSFTRSSFNQRDCLNDYRKLLNQIFKKKILEGRQSLLISL